MKFTWFTIVLNFELNKNDLKCVSWVEPLEMLQTDCSDEAFPSMAQKVRPKQLNVANDVKMQSALLPSDFNESIFTCYKVTQ